MIMKNLMNINIFGYMLFFAFLISCDKDEIAIEEETGAIASEINLIDENYRRDIAIYSKTTVVYEDQQYSIEEMLTDPILFDAYKNAISHVLDQDDVEGTRTLYVYTKKEKAKKFLEEVKRKNEVVKAQKTAHFISTVTFFQHWNYNANPNYNTRYEYTHNWRNVESGYSDVGVKLPTNMINQASSIIWEVSLREDDGANDGDYGVLVLYDKTAQSGAKKILTLRKSGTWLARNLSTINFTDKIDRFNVQSVDK